MRTPAEPLTSSADLTAKPRRLFRCGKVSSLLNPVIRTLLRQNCLLFAERTTPKIWRVLHNSTRSIFFSLFEDTGTSFIQIRDHASDDDLRPCDHLRDHAEATRLGKPLRAKSNARTCCRQPLSSRPPATTSHFNHHRNIPLLSTYPHTCRSKESMTRISCRFLKILEESSTFFILQS